MLAMVKIPYQTDWYGSWYSKDEWYPNRYRTGESGGCVRINPNPKRSFLDLVDLPDHHLLQNVSTVSIALRKDFAKFWLELGTADEHNTYRPLRFAPNGDAPFARA